MVVTVVVHADPSDPMGCGTCSVAQRLQGCVEQSWMGVV